MKTKSKPPSFYSFVITSEDGYRLLGSCLRFYEPIPSKYRQMALKYLQLKGHTCKPNQTLYLAKSICAISRWPFSLAFKQVLCGIYRLFINESTSNQSTPKSAQGKPKIPLERYICNFIDDVPAPPWGRLDVIYYIDEEPVTFRCPPFNEPNSWSSFPLYPLFECLSSENILILFNLVLTERQVVFISSQYNLLTLCSEAITSLMYPITWAHAYIPILPIELLGKI